MIEETIYGKRGNEIVKIDEKENGILEIRIVLLDAALKDYAESKICRIPNEAVTIEKDGHGIKPSRRGVR